MKEYNIGKYKIVAQENMLVSFTENKKIITVVHKRDREIHCIIEYKDGKLLLESGWNIKYSFEDNTLFEKQWKNIEVTVSLQALFTRG